MRQHSNCELIPLSDRFNSVFKSAPGLRYISLHGTHTSCHGSVRPGITGIKGPPLVSWLSISPDLILGFHKPFFFNIRRFLQFSSFNSRICCALLISHVFQAFDHNNRIILSVYLFAVPFLQYQHTKYMIIQSNKSQWICLYSTILISINFLQIAF